MPYSEGGYENPDCGECNGSGYTINQTPEGEASGQAPAISECTSCGGSGRESGDE